MPLVGLAIFVLVLILQHGEIRLITALCDIMVLHSLEHRTTWLMGMAAIGEATLLGELEDFLEVACQLLALHVERAEALDARSVD